MTVSNRKLVIAVIFLILIKLASKLDRSQIEDILIFLGVFVFIIFISFWSIVGQFWRQIIENFSTFS